MTQAELEQRIAKDLARKDMGLVTKAQVLTALQDADNTIIARLMDGIRSRNSALTGEIIVSVVTEYMEGQALSEAQAMFANGTLSLTELDRWLG